MTTPEEILTSMEYYGIMWLHWNNSFNILCIQYMCACTYACSTHVHTYIHRNQTPQKCCHSLFKHAIGIRTTKMSPHLTLNYTKMTAPAGVSAELHWGIVSLVNIQWQTVLTTPTRTPSSSRAARVGVGQLYQQYSLSVVILLQEILATYPPICL